MSLAFPAKVKRINIKGVHVFASKIDTKQMYLVDWYEDGKVESGESSWSS